MKLRFLALLAAALCAPQIVFAAEYQYARFTEIESQSRNKEISLVVSLSAGPGVSALAMKSSGNAVSARQLAYADFYRQLNWNEKLNSDALSVLNRLGRDGWVLVSVRKERTTAFVTKDPAIEEEYFLKRLKPNNK